MSHNSGWLREYLHRPAKKLLRPKASRGRSSHLAVERLEDRVVLDSGGATNAVPRTFLSYGNGPLITNVQVEPIFLQDTATHQEVPATMQAELQAFFQTITADSYIPTLIGAEYSVPGQTIGTGSVGSADADVQVTPQVSNYKGTGAGAISDGQVKDLISQEIANGHTAATNGNTLYYVFTPPGDAATDTQNVTTDNKDDSITGFNGFHSDFVDPNTGKTVYYSVMPFPGPPNNSLTGPAVFQQLTRTSTHELAEAITDPVPGSGWTVTDPNHPAAGQEIGDLASHEAYLQDGYTVQYLWSNALQGPAHAPGAPGTRNLFINQLTPPAVAVTQSVLVATFTDSNTSLTAADFSVSVSNVDKDGASQDWTDVTVVGSNGHFVVMATPPSLAGVHEVGAPFKNDSGLSVEVTENNPLPGDGGNPVSSRYVPYKVAANKAALDYTTDSGTNNLTLSYNGTSGNLELTDNNQPVYTQPLAMTSAIHIGAALGVSNSLTINLGAGWPSGASVPGVTFDGGAGTSSTLQIAGNLPGGPFNKLEDTITGTNAGGISLTSTGNAAFHVTYSNVASVNVSSVATNVVVTVPVPLSDVIQVVNPDNTMTLSGRNGSFAPITFVIPSGSLDIHQA